MPQFAFYAISELDHYKVLMRIAELSIVGGENQKLIDELRLLALNTLNHLFYVKKTVNFILMEA